MMFKYEGLVLPTSSYDNLTMRDEWFFLFACKKIDFSAHIADMRDSVKKSLILSNMLGDDRETLTKLSEHPPNGAFYSRMISCKLRELDISDDRKTESEKLNKNYLDRISSLTKIRNLDLIEFFKNKNLRFNSNKIFLRNLEKLSHEIPKITLSLDNVGKHMHLSEYRNRIFTEKALLRVLDSSHIPYIESIVSKLPKNNIVIVGYNNFLSIKPNIISTEKVNLLDIACIYDKNDMQIKKNIPKIKLSDIEFKTVHTSNGQNIHHDEKVKTMQLIDVGNSDIFLEKYGNIGGGTLRSNTPIFTAILHSSNLSNVPAFNFMHTQIFPPGIPDDLRWSRRSVYNPDRHQGEVNLTDFHHKIYGTNGNTELNNEQETLLEYGYNRIFTKKAIFKMHNNKKKFINMSFVEITKKSKSVMFDYKFQINKNKKIQKIFHSRSMISSVFGNPALIYILSLFNKVALYDTQCKDFFGRLNYRINVDDDSYSGISIYKSSKNKCDRSDSVIMRD